MVTCRICGWLVELDDVRIALRRERCICVRCFEVAVGDYRAVSRALIWAVTAPEEQLVSTKLGPDRRVSHGG